MNQYVTGAVIKELREKAHFTQAELATKPYQSGKRQKDTRIFLY